MGALNGMTASTNRRSLIAAGTVCVLALVCGSGWAAYQMQARSGAQDTFLSWNDPQIVSAGMPLYEQNCAACHGSLEVGSTPANATRHDATGHTWQHPDYALFQLIRDGVAVASCMPVDEKDMPRFASILSDEELVAVLSYIKSTWPQDIRDHHDKVNKMYAGYNRAVGDIIAAGD